MSISASTAAQRIALRDKAHIASYLLQLFAQDSITPNTEQITEIDAALGALTTALTAAGGLLFTGGTTAVTKGQTVSVLTSIGASVTPSATASVVGGTLSFVALPATTVGISNGGTVNVENSAGALDSPATATVAAGVLSGVRLAATKTILTDALKFSGVTITGTGTFFTPTISAGVLTGGVLSAS